MPTIPICRASFIPTRAPRRHCEKVWDFSSTALQKDPRFGRAWTGIAKSWLWLADAYVAPLEAYPKMRDAALNALQLNDKTTPKRTSISARRNAFSTGTSTARSGI